MSTVRSPPVLWMGCPPRQFPHHLLHHHQLPFCCLHPTSWISMRALLRSSGIARFTKRRHNSGPQRAAHRSVLTAVRAPPRGTNLVDLNLGWVGLGALLDSQFEYAVNIGRADAVAARLGRKPE